MLTGERSWSEEKDMAKQSREGEANASDATPSARMSMYRLASPLAQPVRFATVHKITKDPLLLADADAACELVHGPFHPHITEAVTSRCGGGTIAR